MALSYSWAIFKTLTSRNGRLITCVSRTKYFHTKVVSSKDVIQYPQVTGGQDLLHQNIKSAQDVRSILEIIRSYNSIMNNNHIMHALRSMFDLQKLKSPGLGKVDLVNSPEFLQLCTCLKRQARALDISDTIDALKIMSYVGVPSDSDIVDILLQLIRQSVNDLNLLQIVFVDFLLGKCSRSPLCSALKLALPIVFNAHLKTKFDDTYDLSHVVGMLQYAIKSNLPSSSVDFLLGHLEECIDSLDVLNARIVVWNLVKLKNLSNSGQHILSQSLLTMASDIDRIPFKETETILSKLVQMYSPTSRCYYQSDFFNACAKYIVQHDCGLELGTKRLRKISQIGHVDIHLLDYLGSKVIEDPQVLMKRGPSVLISLVSGFSKANYVPVNWDCIRNIILQHRILTRQDNVALPWIKFAIDLAVLNCFPFQLIECIFGDSFLKVFLDRENNFLDHIQLLALYQAVATLAHGYKGPWPSDDVIQKAISMNGTNVNDFPLLGALEKGLGGSSYICTKLYTKLGHFIDHAVVIRKGGFPVAINLSKSNSSRLYIEDLDLPIDCKIILILCFPENYYSLNCSRLKGCYSLLERSLKAMDYGVVVIPLSAWKELPSHEKIPYIMRAINSTYDAKGVVNVDSL